MFMAIEESLLQQCLNAREYWKGNEDLFNAAIEAHETNQSLDQLFPSRMARIFSATSSGSRSHLPKIRKSSVTPNRSVKR